MAKINKSETLLPDSDKTKKFEMLFPMVNSDLNEIRELSKRNKTNL